MKRDKKDEILGVTRSGMVITEEIAEQMAEEFERDGLDPSKVERLYVGHLVCGDPDGPGMAFPLSRAELDAVRQRADQEGRPFSDVAQEELQRYRDS